MWVSKTIQPIHFENSHNLVNYGLSYSTMALIGYFSFLTGHLTDKWGAKKTVGLGGLCYAIGIFLRAFPTRPEIAILSGVFAGLGASAVLSSLRLWMLSLSNENTRAKWVGLKSSTTALGTAIGCALAGIIPSFTMEMRQIQIGAAGFLLFVSMVILFWSPGQKHRVAGPSGGTPWAQLLDVIKSHRNLAITTSLIGVLTGFYVSFVSPYLPLILKERGLSMQSIGLSIGAFSLIRFFADPLIAKLIQRHSQNSLKFFIGAEFFIFLVTGLFAIAFSPSVFIGFLLVRCFALGFSTISEELLWLQKFPKEKVGLLFGLNQSAFFIGDFLGGIVNGGLYQRFGLSACVIVALITIALNVGLFIRTFSRPVTKFALNPIEVASQ